LKHGATLISLVLINRFAHLTDDRDEALHGRTQFQTRTRPDLMAKKLVAAI